MPAVRFQSRASHNCKECPDLHFTSHRELAAHIALIRSSADFDSETHAYKHSKITENDLYLCSYCGWLGGPVGALLTHQTSSCPTLFPSHSSNTQIPLSHRILDRDLRSVLDNTTDAASLLAAMKGKMVGLLPPVKIEKLKRQNPVLIYCNQCKGRKFSFSGFRQHVAVMHESVDFDASTHRMVEETIAFKSIAKRGLACSYCFSIFETHYGLEAHQRDWCLYFAPSVLNFSWEVNRDSDILNGSYKGRSKVKSFLAGRMPKTPDVTGLGLQIENVERPTSDQDTIRVTGVRCPHCSSDLEIVKLSLELLLYCRICPQFVFLPKLAKRRVTLRLKSKATLTVSEVDIKRWKTFHMLAYMISTGGIGEEGKASVGTAGLQAISETKPESMRERKRREKERKRRKKERQIRKKERQIREKARKSRERKIREEARKSRELARKSREKARKIRVKKAEKEKAEKEKAKRRQERQEKAERRNEQAKRWQEEAELSKKAKKYPCIESAGRINQPGTSTAKTKKVAVIRTPTFRCRRCTYKAASYEELRRHRTENHGIVAISNSDQATGWIRLPHGSYIWQRHISPSSTSNGIESSKTQKCMLMKESIVEQNGLSPVVNQSFREGSESEPSISDNVSSVCQPETSTAETKKVVVTRAPIFRCRRCTYRAASFEALKRHRAEIHGIVAISNSDQATEWIMLPHGSSIWRRHIFPSSTSNGKESSRKRKLSKKSLFSCTSCSFDFLSSEELREHMTLMEESADFVEHEYQHLAYPECCEIFCCSYCPEKYTKVEHLMEHQLDLCTGFSCSQSRVANDELNII